jgi:hypothetical protein
MPEPSMRAKLLIGTVCKRHSRIGKFGAYDLDVKYFTRRGGAKLKTSRVDVLFGMFCRFDAIGGLEIEV